MNSNKTILSKVRSIANIPAPVPAPVVLRTYETQYGKLAQIEAKRNDSVWGSRNSSR